MTYLHDPTTNPGIIEIRKQISHLLFEVAVQDFWRVDEIHNSPVDAKVPLEVTKVLSRYAPIMGQKTLQEKRRELQRLLNAYNVLTGNNNDISITDTITDNVLDILNTEDKQIEDKQIEDKEIEQTEDKRDDNTLFTLISEVMNQHRGQWKTARDISRGKSQLQREYKDEVKPALEWLVMKGKIQKDSDGETVRYRLPPIPL